MFILPTAVEVVKTVGIRATEQGQIPLPSPADVAAHDPRPLIDYVRAMPMPLPLKEAILDQVLGYHDDLHDDLNCPQRLCHQRVRRPARPLAERVAEAAKVGGFKLSHRDACGDWHYTYHKDGVTLYDVLVREDEPLWCTCKDFTIQVHRNPSYVCKHLELYRSFAAGDIASLGVDYAD